MIKFFRHIRKDLMETGKTSKYIKYAFGEIVLVVIGILIALSINNWNQNRQNKQKVDKLLSKIQRDIATDIASLNNEIDFYYVKDSICKLVLGKKLNEEDYKGPNRGSLYSLLLLHNGPSLKRNSYDNLMKIQDIIPEAYDSIIDKLSFLYNDAYGFVTSTNDNINELVMKNIDDLHQSYNWFAPDNMININDKQIDFLLNSNKYQSMVKLYQGLLVSNLTEACNRYAQDAITFYNDIDQILSKDSESSRLRRIMDSTKVGLYKSIQGDTLTYEIRNDGPYLNDAADTVRVYHISPDKFYYPLQNFFMRFETKNDSTNLYLSAFQNGAKPFATKIN